MKRLLFKNSCLRGVLLLFLCIVGIGNVCGEVVNFKLHTGDVTDGYYIIVSNGVAMNNQTSNNRLQYDNITISNNIIQAESNARYVWHITSEGNDTYTIKNANNNYYAVSTGTKNQATTQNGTIDNKSKWYITNNETTCSIENVYNKKNDINYTIRRNSTYGFACYATSTGTGPILYKKIDEPEQTKTVTSLSISETPSNTTYYVGEEPSAEGLKVTATYSDNTTNVVTSSVSWSYTPATITSGTKYFTATASYEGKEATSDPFNITVKSIANTAESAYSVAQACTIIDAGKGLSEEVYVKGIVSQVDNFNDEYGSITYWISYDGTTTSQQFQCYGGLNIDGTQFTSINDLKLGSVVVVKGLLKKYNTTYEFDENNVIISNDESNARTLSSIEISETPTKTSYYVGDTPSADGLRVNAVYSDESTIDVTDDTEWTFKPEHIEEGTTQLTVTATYRSLTTSYTYNIATTTAPIAYTHTLDLSTKTYYSATTNTVEWNANVAKITLRKAESNTNANNYLGGGENAHTRVYKGQTIVITPYTSCTKMIFTSTSADYAAKSLSYENATAEVSGTEIIVTPIVNDKDITITVGVATRFVKMDIYYSPIESTVSSARYATFCLPYDATIPEGLTAYTATDNGESVKLHTKEGGKIAAGEGVVLEGDEGTYTFVAAEGSVKTTAGNQMVGVTKDTKLTGADNAYMLTRKKEDGSIAFRLLKADYTLGANKAYLKASNTANIRELIPALWDDNATGIDNIAKDEVTATGAIYNLAGQKLMRAQKGINIINGKLVIK